MRNILSINGGSSSIRFALFEVGEDATRLMDGKVERLGTEHANLIAGCPGKARERIALGAQNGAGAQAMVHWLRQQTTLPRPDAIGHRVVHGMQRAAPQRVTASLLHELRAILALDPEHMPAEIELIEAMQREYAGVAQVACFDTAFHRDMPLVATQLPIPRRFSSMGVQRYGFHGLSYTFLMQHLTHLGQGAAEGRLILAHLGGGSSMAAVRDGRSVDTSMGFTPTGGLMMGTRTGDLDPGLMSYLALTNDLSAAQFRTMVNHESGLLGVSETSADVRDLLARESEDPRAREALALYCYQAKKWIGSFAAVLGGLDTLVFAGGIGENAAVIRKRVCEGLDFLGIDIDPVLNERHAPVISPSAAKVAVRVISTDEEIVIAELTNRLLDTAEAGSTT